MLTVIILTYNETMHIERCINSVINLASRIIVVDSYSSDNTTEIAVKLGVEVFQNKFINQAVQFQWALDNCSIKDDWILRLDADEYLTKKLIEEIANKLPNISDEINGVFLKRRVYFMDKWIKYGGYYPIKLLRLWRNGTAVVEQKWMDEHIILKEGISIEFKNDFIDYNLNNLQWWTQKHNNYSTREVIEYFDEKLDFFKSKKISHIEQTQASRKRENKVNYYNKAPLFFRALLYFIYRYIFKLGFLDGKRGVIWHFLQGFWYRFLVDAKIYQIKYIAKKEKMSIEDVIIKVFEINFKNKY
jgi:glycosyltransferase involved in cell wall biosynthesis